MISIGMASIKEREVLLQKTLDSLVDSQEEIGIHLYLNGYDEKPNWLYKYPIENIVCSKENFGDRGKFAFEQEGYCFSCDDDIIYPKDYISSTIKKLDFYKNKVVTYHGKRVPRKKVKSFYRNTSGFHFAKDMAKDELVHIPGTGVMAWHAETISFPVELFTQANMADIFAGIQAKENNVEIMCLSHSLGWIKAIKTKNNICRTYRSADENQTRLVNSINWHTQ